MKIGHGMGAEVANDEPAVAKLLAELSSALDVQYERANALEAKCAALAAENAGLKQAESNLVRNIINDLGDTEFQYARVQTPATDSFLAESRAQGAEECVRQLVISGDDDFSDAPNVCAMVAHQLRKGVQS
ncbi:hypothetical protein ACQSIR_002143 [Escherichia coli]